MFITRGPIPSPPEAHAPNLENPVPLKTLTPPKLRRVARAAAFVRLKEIQDMSAELLRIKLGAQKLETTKPPRIAAPKRVTKKARQDSFGLPEPAVPSRSVSVTRRPAVLPAKC